MSRRDYSFFSYRRNALPLDREQAFHLERTFAAVRYLHNHFVTILSPLTKKRLKSLDLSQGAFHALVDSLIKPEEAYIFSEIHFSFIETAVMIIADDWRRYANNCGPLPTFIYPRDEQTVWMTYRKVIHVFQEGFSFPGSNEVIPIQPPRIRLLGKPSIYYLHRSMDERYYLVTMYEHPVSQPHERAPAALARFGALLQKALNAKKEPLFDSLPESLTIPGLIRKRALVKLLNPKPEKVSLDETPDDFTF